MRVRVVLDVFVEVTDPVALQSHAANFDLDGPRTLPDHVATDAERLAWYASFPLGEALNGRGLQIPGLGDSDIEGHPQRPNDDGSWPAFTVERRTV